MGAKSLADAQSQLYSPLALGFIRVLELFPGRRNDRICCRLRCISLQQAGDIYEAISYAWGDPGNTVNITCDDIAVDITLSLAGALRAVRDYTVIKLVWADAICVNQADDVEKGHQVALMGRVFESASTVTVWLGDDDQNPASDCFELIRQTNAYMNQLLNSYGDPTIVPMVRAPCPIPDDRARWRQVRTLYYLPWFRRLWVVQEVALAKACVMVWGRQRIDITELVELALWIGLNVGVWTLSGDIGSGHLYDIFTTIHCAYRNPITWRTRRPLIRHFQDFSRAQSYSILHILDTGRQLQSTHAVDRVYAFLSNPLTHRSRDSAGTELMVEPDYTKNEDEVYFEIACALLRNPEDALYVLPCVYHASEEDLINSNFPSWVPRWDRRRKGYSMNIPFYWYRAEGNDNHHHEYAGSNRIFSARVMASRTLVARGLVFDYVSWTSDIMKENNLDLDSNNWDPVYRTKQKPFIDHLWLSVLRNCGHKDAIDSCNLQDSFLMAATRGFPRLQDDDKQILELGRAQFAAYWRAVRLAATTPAAASANSRPPTPDDPDSRAQAQHCYSSLAFTKDNRLCTTRSGRLGLVPRLARPGDAACVFPGIRTPIILRPLVYGTYKVVGPSYIHGVMRGELVNGTATRRLKEVFLS